MRPPYCTDAVTSGGNEAVFVYPAMRACLDLCLMFCYFYFYRRNVENLPFLVISRFDIGEYCAAQVALLDFIQFDVIRLFHRFQCVANMPLLPAILFVARLSPAFGARLLETIAGRGLAAVFAILVRSWSCRACKYESLISQPPNP